MNKKLVLLGTCLLIGAGSVSAQKRVTGRVVDTNGEPVIGATVRVDGTKFVTVTDDKGNFTLNGLPASAKRVSVSYIGMESATVSVAGNMRIVMKQNDQVLDEAVVIGYGTARKIGTVVGAVSKVSGETIAETPSTNVMDAMQGDHNPYTKFNYGWLTTSKLITTKSEVTVTLDAFVNSGDTVIIANFTSADTVSPIR
mgnify:CR=1 FL=1